MAQPYTGKAAMDQDAINAEQTRKMMSWYDAMAPQREQNLKGWTNDWMQPKPSAANNPQPLQAVDPRQAAYEAGNAKRLASFRKQTGVPTDPFGNPLVKTADRLAIDDYNKQRAIGEYGQQAYDDAQAKGLAAQQKRNAPAVARHQADQQAADNQYNQSNDAPEGEGSMQPYTGKSSMYPIDMNSGPSPIHKYQGGTSKAPQQQPMSFRSMGTGLAAPGAPQQGPYGGPVDVGTSYQQPVQTPSTPIQRDISTRIMGAVRPTQAIKGPPGATHTADPFGGGDYEDDMGGGDPFSSQQSSQQGMGAAQPLPEKTAGGGANTSPTAFAAPVLVGIMFTAAARARSKSPWALSTRFWSLV